MWLGLRGKKRQPETVSRNARWATNPRPLVLVRLMEEHDAWRHRCRAVPPCESGLCARGIPTRDEPRTSIARHVRRVVAPLAAGSSAKRTRKPRGNSTPRG